MRTHPPPPLPSPPTQLPSNNQPTEMNKILKQKRGFPPIYTYLDRCNGAHLFTCTYFSHDTQLTIDMMSECVCLCISNPTTTTSSSSSSSKTKQEIQTKQGVHHNVALPFTLKSKSRQKEEEL